MNDLSSLIASVRMTETRGSQMAYAKPAAYVREEFSKYFENESAAGKNWENVAATRAAPYGNPRDVRNILSSLGLRLIPEAEEKVSEEPSAEAAAVVMAAMFSPSGGEFQIKDKEVNSIVFSADLKVPDELKNLLAGILGPEDSELFLHIMEENNFILPDEPVSPQDALEMLAQQAKALKTELEARPLAILEAAAGSKVEFDTAAEPKTEISGSVTAEPKAEFGEPAAAEPKAEFAIMEAAESLRANETQTEPALISSAHDNPKAGEPEKNVFAPESDLDGQAAGGRRVDADYAETGSSKKPAAGTESEAAWSRQAGIDEPPAQPVSFKITRTADRPVPEPVVLEKKLTDVAVDLSNEAASEVAAQNNVTEQTADKIAGFLTKTGEKLLGAAETMKNESATLQEAEETPAEAKPETVQAETDVPAAAEQRQAEDSGQPEGGKSGGSELNKAKKTPAAQETGNAVPIARSEEAPAAGFRLEAAAAAKHTLPSSVIDQIVKSASLHKAEGVSKLELQLNPEFLGKVSIALTSTENGVTASIKAANESARNLLANNISELQNSLKNMGINMENIELSHSSLSSEHQAKQNGGHFSEDRNGSFERLGRVLRMGRQSITEVGPAIYSAGSLIMSEDTSVEYLA